MKPEHQDILLFEENPAKTRLMVELFSKAGGGNLELQHADIVMVHARRQCKKTFFFNDRKDCL